MTKRESGLTMKKSIWIIGGVAVAAVGFTAAGALAERGGDGWHGRHHGGGWQHHGRGGEKNGRYRHGRHHGEGRRGRRGPVSKEDYDAETRGRFARWDINGDGVVDRSEVEKRITSRMERRMHRRGGGGQGMRMINRFDEDRDGTVTKAEIETYVTRMFTRMDLDGDGKITDADLPPMMRGLDIIKGERPHFAMGLGREGHEGRRTHGRRGGMPMLRHMLGADANKDGEITIEEAQAIGAKRAARFDRNGDGNIDQADRDALRAEMLDYRVRRFLHHFGANPDTGLTLEQFTTHRNERFARRDVDGDGVLSRRERRGGHGLGGGRGEHHGHRGRGRGHGDGPRGGGDSERGGDRR
jgi:Ca2+-binding EF-hand superfamily protein